MTDPGQQRSALSHRRSVAVIAVAVAAVAAVVAGASWWVFSGDHGGAPASPQAGSQGPGQGPPPPAGAAVCDQPILDSPWHYDGAPGTYTVAVSRPACPPSARLRATSLPPPRSSWCRRVTTPPPRARVAYNVDHTVVYFEPGIHDIENGMYTGHESAYIGGYTRRAGRAVLDGVDGGTNGTGKGGSRPGYSTPSSGNNVYDTWEYLTIKNFTSSQNSSVMGNVNGGAGGSDVGDVYKYDTIGPNEYGSQGGDAAPKTGESNGGGYAIDAGSNTTIEYNCLTHNAQGGFNVEGAVNLSIEHNEISWNGLGEYPG